MGSIHHVNEISFDDDVPTYRKALESFGFKKEDDRLEAFMLAYFDAQYELIQHFKREVIAHFDPCRLYNPNLRFADFPVVQKMIERNVCYAVEYGALFEINTAALRKGWQSPYPGEDVVEVCYIILTQDSDSAYANRSFPFRYSIAITGASHYLTTATDPMQLA